MCCTPRLSRPKLICHRRWESAIRARPMRPDGPAQAWLQGQRRIRRVTDMDLPSEPAQRRARPTIRRRGILRPDTVRRTIPRQAFHRPTLRGQTIPRRAWRRRGTLRPMKTFIRLGTPERPCRPRAKVDQRHGPADIVWRPILRPRTRRPAPPRPAMLATLVSKTHPSIARPVPLP
jgi:hypothetical protein